ncbi:hypothetical protein SNE40_023415 [Patella caerulea]|uniref:Normal mucosa of esophagus-specific gene 1 protein n=1 Tax=Patella caerulea TaxID=87958 RepID=A0AAN8G6D6_PATCE
MSTNQKFTGKTFGFGMVAMKKFPELIPLVGFISAAVIGCGAYMAYALITKPDVRINKSSELPPWERVAPTERRKFFVINEKYQENEELSKLRKEIGSFKC